MGKPTVEIAPGIKVTPLEARTIAEYCGNGQNQLAAAQAAGMGDPVAHAAKTFARPRVISALNAVLESVGATPTKIIETYNRNLDHKNGFVQLHAADSLSRIMGEFTQPDDKPNADTAPLLVLNVIVDQSSSAPPTLRADVAPDV